MSNKLKGLMILIATAAAATLVGKDLYIPHPEATVAELVDAGYTDGSMAIMECGFRLSSEAQADFNTQARYVALACRAREFSDGVILNKRLLKGRGYVDLVRPELCRKRATCDDPDLCAGSDITGTLCKAIAHPCACRTNNQCFLKNQDGSQGSLAPYGITLREGDVHAPYGFTGAGCRRKACGEFAGESSWPDECPQQ